MSLMKLTVLGDITCDKPLLNASRVKRGVYDFDPVFSEVKPLLEGSDFVVANFETVCAGSKDDFKSGFLLYNTPDALVPAMRDAGVHFVTTANNHCLDQGIEGLKRTLSILDAYGVAHIGTFATPEERENLQVIQVGGIKIAILAYTHGTNESNTGVVLNETNDYLVGLLRKQRNNAQQAGGLKGFIAKHISIEQKRDIMRFISRMKLRMGIAYFKPFVDRITSEDTPENPYLVKLKEDIAEAKKEADLVIVCPHMGGQFNVEPGTYSEFLVDYIKSCGADVVAANHPHVVQKAKVDEGCVEAYSIGGFNLSVSADYIVHESLPEYSMALHIYVDKESKKVASSTFSILKIVESDDHHITVYPVHRLPEEHLTEEGRKDITAIYNRISGNQAENIEIAEEYPLQ